MSESPREKLAAMRFAYDGDARANKEIEHRIAHRAGTRLTIRYSELVAGVTFHLPNVAGGSPFFKHGKYPDVILPMCVIRRMDALLDMHLFRLASP